MKHKSMRPAIFVLIALVLSAPTLASVAGGTDPAVGAGEHLAAAVLVSWGAVSVVGHLVDSYRAAALRREQRHSRHAQPAPSSSSR